MSYRRTIYSLQM